jgi:geranylgeranyl diphosphate synthase type II
MGDRQRIERALGELLANLDGDSTPPVLRRAMLDAVFPGGNRLRPRLALSVARACGDGGTALAVAGAVACELLHCASLVHDDLPCFDDASLRRGRPSVHLAHGEPVAVLAGDGLIVLAFDALARDAGDDPVAATAMIRRLADAAGAVRGLVSGQAWESEPRIPLHAYHRAKTGALFQAAAELGALAAGVDPEAWARLGSTVGEAYQLFDDLRDAGQAVAPVDKPLGRDALLGRPNAALALGPDEAVDRLALLLDAATARIPPCPRPTAIADWLHDFAARCRSARGPHHPAPERPDPPVRVVVGSAARG